jgi:hypothetical protein
MRPWVSKNSEKLRILAATLITLNTVACGQVNSDDLACTELFAYGATVSVVDASTQLAVSGAVITAISDSGIESDVFTEHAGMYIGLGETTGTWTVHVSKSGYASQDQTLTLESDGCHVIGQSLTVELQPD